MRIINNYKLKIIKAVITKETKEKIEISEIEKDFPIEDLEKLCIDFLIASNAGFVNNNKIYIEHWLEKCF